MSNKTYGAVSSKGLYKEGDDKETSHGCPNGIVNLLCILEQDEGKTAEELQVGEDVQL